MKNNFKPLWHILCLIVALLLPDAAKAQTVNVSTRTGNVIVVKGTDQELQANGFGGMWVHNQLPMNMMCCDAGEFALTPDGLLKTHANNISSTLFPDRGITLLSGAKSWGYLALTLPEGYRFTGYKAVVKTDIKEGDLEKPSSDGSWTSSPLSFAETQADGTTEIGQSQDLGTMGSNTTRTLARTSLQEGDMGNKLYFRYGANPGGGFAGMSLVSLEVSFACNSAFTATVKPADNVSGVDCALASFHSGRIDLGEITTQKKGTKTFFGYNHANVRDLPAYSMIYNRGGIDANGKPNTATVTDGLIASAVTAGGQAFALKSGTYWVETPTELEAEGNVKIPVGYRIVGARVNYWNEAVASDLFTITNGDGLYMGPAIKWGSKSTLWQTDGQGGVYTTLEGGQRKWLAYKESGLFDKTYTAITQDSKPNVTFTVANGRVSFGNWNKRYLQSDGTFATSTGNAATVTMVEPAKMQYTVKLYDKTGTQVEQTATVGADNPTGTLAISGLNNDAVKLEVEAEDGQTAYITVDLDIEALNPYVQKMDVVCTQESGEKKQLSQQFLADDFAVGGGSVNFYVPTNFAGSGQMDISFNNLYSKDADNTYFDGNMTGNARYSFVRSPYYDIIGEDLHTNAAAAADHTYADKVQVSVVGNKAFTFNNTQQLADQGSTGTAHFEEYLYSNAEYAAQGGSYTGVKLANGETHDCYLATADETRYNISPATGMRHMYYAFYRSNITLRTADYFPTVEYKKIYETTLTADGLDPNPYYGAVIGLTDGDGKKIEAGTGYVYPDQITGKISETIKDPQVTTPKPVDGKHLLYLDLGNVYSVIFDTQEGGGFGTMQSLRDLIATNGLVYLPNSVSSNMDNMATKSIDGSTYNATNNIELTDLQPFYAPYDIYINAANHARYVRKYTPTNGKVNFVTVTMPFTVGHTEGVYTSDDGQTQFTFYDMQNTHCISADPDKMTGNPGEDFYGLAHFTPYTGGYATEANHPYLVEVNRYDGETGDDGKVLFVLTQKGATIMATTPQEAEKLGGQQKNGTIGGNPITLKQYGTYAGAQLPKVGNYLYFWKNKLVSSKNLEDEFPVVYVAPFRTYYEYEGVVNNLAEINVSLTPNGDATHITGPTGHDGTLTLMPSGGMLTIKANAATPVAIHNMQGQAVMRGNMQQGDTMSVPLKAGVYVVNGRKVAVAR